MDGFGRGVARRVRSVPCALRSQERDISLTYSVIMNVTTIPQLVKA